MFAEYAPDAVEMVDDASCNVIWDRRQTAAEVIIVSFVSFLKVNRTCLKIQCWSSHLLCFVLVTATRKIAFSCLFLAEFSAVFYSTGKWFRSSQAVKSVHFWKLMRDIISLKKFFECCGVSKFANFARLQWVCSPICSSKAQNNPIKWCSKFKKIYIHSSKVWWVRHMHSII